MRNRFPGTCYVCKKRVEKGEGHFEKLRGRVAGAKWRVKCAPCAIENHRRREAAALEVPGEGRQG